MTKKRASFYCASFPLLLPVSLLFLHFPEPQTKATVSAGINAGGTDPSPWTSPKPKHQWPLEPTDSEVNLARRKKGRKAKNKHPLDSKADEHTKGSKIPLETMSTPAHDVRLGLGQHCTPLPSPAYHGPNFEKGPLQAEIRQDLGMMSIWNPDTKIQDVPLRPEFKGRAHSIHSPVFHHRPQEPYEKLPGCWTDQMKAERDEYHRLRDSEGNRAAVNEAKVAASNKSNFQTLTYGKSVVDGISRASKGKMAAKL